MIKSPVIFGVFFVFVFVDCGVGASKVQKNFELNSLRADGQEEE